MIGTVIIGAGECGVRAAFALREHGHERPITLISAEAVVPYERPPLSKGLSGEPKLIRTEAAYAQAQIDLRLGAEVTGIDRDAHKVRLRDGSDLPYDKLLLATGARARLFAGMEGCQTLRADADAAAIHRHFKPGARVGIVGGGFIGLELAATARQAGADVTVVEAAPRVLARAVPQLLARFIHDRHAAEGVTLVTGIGVARADATTIVLADGRTLGFDTVIAGVGALPNTRLAQDAGLDVDNGIVVDQNFRTSDPDIHAAGDCCNFLWRGQRVRLESWRAAQDQGAHAAAAMLGAEDNYAKVPWFWSDQYDLTLQVAGLFDMARDVQQRPTTDDNCIVFQCNGEHRLSAVAGVGTGNAVAKAIRILEKLIERESLVEPSALADPSFNLKTLLKTA
jgi:3-phenylpropionate/trans-cinnamate dioxygenase ferredoxin reductase subunit